MYTHTYIYIFLIFINIFLEDIANRDIREKCTYIERKLYKTYLHIYLHKLYI